MFQKKKIIAGFCIMTALCILAPITGAKAETTKKITDDNGVYTVTIPADVSIDLNTKSAEFTVKAEVEPYNELNIKIASENKYQLKCGENYGLAYTLSDEAGQTISEIKYSTQNITDNSKSDFSTKLKVAVSDAAEAQVSGIYSDILSFETKCQESYPEGKAKLSFDANGGTVEINSKVLDINQVYGELPVPVRTGYTFTGWYTGAEDGEIVSEDTKITQHTTIYAHWTANTYTVKYNGNIELHTSVSGTMEDSNMTYDSGVGLKNCEFINSDSGATFMGWNTSPDGTGVSYNAGDTFNLTTENGRVITLYAQWQYENIVKVRFEDVKGNMENDTREVVKESLSAGKTISWSVEELPEWINNQTQWEKQWQTPENNGAVNYTTENKSKTTTIDIKRQMYYLDVNGQWQYADGTVRAPGTGNLLWKENQPAATIAVEINGDPDLSVSGNGTDYFRKQRYGSKFKITITMMSGFELQGFTQTEGQPLSSVTGSGNVVEGVVTGERHVINSSSNTYFATTLAFVIRCTTEYPPETSQQILDE